MTPKRLIFFAVMICCCYCYSLLSSGCAQIGAPTGGPKDTIAPVLLSAEPKLLSTSFTANKIVLNFNEYIDVQEATNNVLVAPYPKNFPTVSFKLKTVTVKLKDTLLPNTTYSINFGNAIRDNNEGNPYKNFTYVFSTGKTIDSLQLSGKVMLAETGKTDSTIIALLYRETADSAVQKRKPDYIARVNSNGTFTFKYLHAGSYKVYALKDGDGSKTYNAPTELFAFTGKEINLPNLNDSLVLYAYAEEKDKKATTVVKPDAKQEKKLKFTTSLSFNQQDLLSGLDISFNHPLKKLERNNILLTDTSFNKIPGYTVQTDSFQKSITIKNTWKEDEFYRLIIPKDAIADSAGVSILKNDTLFFKTKKESDYGTILIHFKNIDPAKHPVLLFMQNDEVVKSVIINSNNWSDKRFQPGEYELRILFDDNQNGKWDPGNYSKKIQPEKAITLDNKLTIKANWDNERDILL